MKKIVISGNSSLTADMARWRDFFDDDDHEILDWPRPIDDGSFEKEFPDIHRNFWRAIGDADMLFVANVDRDKKKGYIGSGVFAEISFALGLNFLRENAIDIVLLQMPDSNSNCADDIERWLSLDWIRVLDPEVIDSRHKL